MDDWRNELAKARREEGQKTKGEKGGGEEGKEMRKKMSERGGINS